MKKRLLTNEEIDWLASAYIKLKKNPTYQQMNKEFQEFIGEYLDQELLTIKAMKGNRDER